MPDDYYVSQYSGEEWDSLLSGVAGGVRYDKAQSLTEAQQKQARENIDIDPPAMELGVEYRTTERYLGKPVYCKTIFVGDVAANTQTVARINNTNNTDVHFRAFCVGKRKYGTGDWTDGVTEIVASPCSVVSCEPVVYRLNSRSTLAYILSTVDLKDVYCTGYYTKTTD